MVQELTPAGKITWRIAVIIQSIMGFTMGLYLFTYGPLFYERFSEVVDKPLAMTLTTLIFGMGMGLMVLLEVPTGAIGDAIGRKQTVVWSMLFRFLFFVSMAFVSLAPASFAWILLFSLAARIMFATSYSLYSGAFTAWCVDSMRRTDPEVGYEHILSTTYFSRFIMLIFGGILGVICYLNGLTHVGFLIAAGICVVGTIFCLGEMLEDGVGGMPVSESLKFELITRRMGEIIGVGFQVFRRSPIILALVTMFSTYLFVLNIVDYLWPVYLRSRIVEGLQGYYWVLLVVLAYSACALGTVVFKAWSARNTKKLGVKRMDNGKLQLWLILACLISSIPIILLSWLTANGLDTFWYFVLSILPLYVAFGIIAPCFETLVNNHIPDDHAKERATILSFANLLRSLLVLLLAVPSGGTSGAMTTVGWAIPAGLLLIATIVGTFVLKRNEKEQKDKLAVQSGIATGF